MKEAYSSVGGLANQIEAIRDLLEIPLTRPELFRYFGTLAFYVIDHLITLYLSVRQASNLLEVSCYTAHRGQARRI